MPRPSLDAMSSADLAACQALLRRGSKSFAAASILLPKSVRDPAAALYAFCRVADDAIDDGQSAGAIDDLHERLDGIFAGAPREDPVDRALARVVAAHDLPRPLFDALLEGFAWDAEGRRYDSISDVCAYGARVAGTVGALMTVLMGPRSPEVMARACDLGVAMQLTNIARDVGEDARRGRLYLPLAWLDEAGVDPATFLRDPRPDRRIASVVERILRFADGLYVRADAGIAMLPRSARPAIRAARLIYADIGRAIALAGFDSVSRRAVVSSGRKIWLVLRALLSRGEPPCRLRAPPLPETLFLVSAAARPEALP